MVLCTSNFGSTILLWYCLHLILVLQYYLWHNLHQVWLYSTIFGSFASNFGSTVLFWFCLLLILVVQYYLWNCLHQVWFYSTILGTVYLQFWFYSTSFGTVYIWFWFYSTIFGTVYTNFGSTVQSLVLLTTNFHSTVKTLVLFTTNFCSTYNLWYCLQPILVVLHMTGILPSTWSWNFLTFIVLVSIGRAIPKIQEDSPYNGRFS